MTLGYNTPQTKPSAPQPNRNFLPHPITNTASRFHPITRPHKPHLHCSLVLYYSHGSTLYVAHLHGVCTCTVSNVNGCNVLGR